MNKRVNLPAEGFVRLPAILAVTGLSRSTIYNLMAAGRLSQPVKCGAANLWRVRDVRRLIKHIERGALERVSLHG